MGEQCFELKGGKTLHMLFVKRAAQFFVWNDLYTFYLDGGDFMSSDSFGNQIKRYTGMQ